MTDERRTVDVTLPQLGESVAEGTVTSWLKAEGERVTEDEPLCEISTDKVNTDIPSPATGELVERAVAEGATVDVGTVLARIAVDAAEAAGTRDAAPGGAAAEPSDRLHFEDSSISMWGPTDAGGAEEVADAAGTSAAVGPQEEEPDSGTGERVRATPAVRALAREKDVALSEVTGTGRGGRVTRDDVLRFLEERDAAGGDWHELSPVRRVIAERLSESKSTIPHSTTVVEADLTTVGETRAAVRSSFEEREGIPLTYLPFVASATLDALQDHPMMNARFEGEGVRIRPRVHLGVAVATEAGLLVPVVHAADDLTFSELASRMHDLAGRAREGALEPDDVQGGTFTLTNHGRGGSLWGTPIIVPGQTGILGVGKIRDVPRVRDGDVVVRKACYLSLSFDHRTVDGAEADAFLASVVETLGAFGPEAVTGL